MAIDKSSAEAHKKQLDKLLDPPTCYWPNPSGLHPLGCAVLIEPYEPEIAKGMLVLPQDVKERTTMIEMRAVVIEVGPACWPDEPPRAKPGDKVFVTKFAGHMVVGTKNGKQYRLVNDRDIFCRLED